MDSWLEANDRPWADPRSLRLSALRLVADGGGGGGGGGVGDGIKMLAGM